MSGDFLKLGMANYSIIMIVVINVVYFSNNKFNWCNNHDDHMMITC